MNFSCKNILDQYVQNDLWAHLNTALRMNKKPPAETFVLDRLCEEDLAPALLWRGYSTSLIPQKDDLLSDHAFLSTSLDPSVAMRFANASASYRGNTSPILMIISGAKKGHLVKNSSEAEVILPRNLPLQVIRVQTGPQLTFVHARHF